MIKLNDNVIEQGRFPDGTLALNMENSLMDDVMFEQVITWLYDGDDEMFTIMSLVDMLKRTVASLTVLMILIFSMPAVANGLDTSEISAVSAVLYCPEYGTVLFEKNPENIRLH